MVNLSAAVLRWARAEPGRPALIYGEQRLGYGDLAARLSATAGSLRARGIGEGDIVALLMKNSAAFIELALAASHVGAVFLPARYFIREAVMLGAAAATAERSRRVCEPAETGEETITVGGKEYRGYYSIELHDAYKSIYEAITHAGDLAAILTNLERNDVLFIDEIHRLNPAVEEILYPAMEDFQLDIMIGEGPAARSIKLDLPPFTLVGATTRAGQLTSPLRDRFGIVARLEFYSEDELTLIVQRAARLLGFELDEALVAALPDDPALGEYLPASTYLTDIVGVRENCEYIYFTHSYKFTTRRK